MVCARETSSSTSFMVIGNTPVLLNSYSVAQAFGGSDPDVFSGEVDGKNVMVRRSGADIDVRDVAGRIANQHFGLTRIESRPIHGPAFAVVIRKALVGGEPGAL